MAETEQQVVNASRTAKDEWDRTKETMMQHVESLQLKVEKEKKKVTSEAPLMYTEIEEERNAQEEKVEIRQYHERVVHVAALTNDRLQEGLQEKCATITEEHDQGKATDDEGTKEEWQVAQLVQGENSHLDFGSIPLKVESLGDS
ncbi:hypothetical protein E2C01_091544 [Portunus trituberculatus]|uniref:Uncharacterized protein n=1 Tax=Portunus trituberculatus TaxID=210409 RepID=A0A5B7JPC4_PORTR|nr:hypothetical protein [Portunus trituberculatus]